MISHDHKAMMVHIPKTGGSSFERLLCGKVFDNLPEQHLDAREMRVTYGRETWENYFTFSFVRNPWDLMVSLYTFLLHYNWPEKRGRTGGNNAYKSELDSVRRHIGRLGLGGPLLGAPPLLAKCKSGPLSFSDFIDESPSFSRYSTAGQLKYLIDRKGKIELDFIGRFENFEEDAGKVLDTLGVKEKIGHEKKTEHDHYSTYYDERTKDKIYKLFRRDIKYFGYEFEKG